MRGPALALAALLVACSAVPDAEYTPTITPYTACGGWSVVCAPYPPMPSCDTELCAAFPPDSKPADPPAFLYLYQGGKVFQCGASCEAAAADAYAECFGLTPTPALIPPAAPPTPGPA